MYKVSADKAINIICCLAPPRIVVNHIAEIDGVEFVNNFKSEGYNVVSVPLEAKSRKRAFGQIARLLKKADVQLMVEGCFTIEEIREHFSELIIFSYVYLFPNTLKVLAEHAVRLGVERGSKEEFTKYINSANEKNKSTYSEHCEEFEDKVFTVLV
jgi:hypothetical protein